MDQQKPKKRYASQQKALNKYLKDKWKRVGFRLHIVHDADVIAWIDAQANIAGALKSLIRAQIKASEGATDAKNV